MRCQVILFRILGISTLLQSIKADCMFVIEIMHVVLVLQVIELDMLEFIHDILVLKVFTLWVLVQSNLRDYLLSKHFHEDVAIIRAYSRSELLI